MELLGVGAPPTPGLTLPVTGTSLAKCLRDANISDARAPPVLAIALGKKTAQRGLFVDYTMHFAFGGSDYMLCAVVCQANTEVWTMADDGSEWTVFRGGTRTALHDMNALITKDAAVLFYKKKR
jgi:hypothetical protein